MSIYLSVDLDFWGDNAQRPFPTLYLRRLFTSGLPLTVVISHENMLPHINRHPADTLVNMDTHDDICCLPEDSKDVNCGTWAAFVEWRKRGKFVWLHPHDSNYHAIHNERYRCDREFNLYSQTNKGITGWPSVKSRRTLLTAAEREQVKAIGLSISPDYIEWPQDRLARLFKLLRKYRIPIDDLEKAGREYEYVDDIRNCIADYKKTKRL